MIESTRALILADDDELVDPRTDASAESASTVDAVARAVVEHLRAERRRERIVVRSERRLLFLRQDEIDWVEAAGNYVRLHVGTAAHVLRQSMKNMEARLDPANFVRIHRSAIVNVGRIRELQPWLHGEYVVILEDGTRLSASRVFSDRLDALID
ncbi:MAG TPA: LytTR family DNA-binding domain-containing protein [Gemmatimonadaceae bacterium]|nr:LytTR family DNA-binding domain-containing protein [Gemmatimonadaceae bacterium]